jgi:uncharacterized protein YdbL (DUF1318 family)
MRKLLALPALAAAVTLAACVTINVYFPAAQAQEAAREFVEDVIGGEAAPGAGQGEGQGGGAGGALGDALQAAAGAVLDAVIPSAHAQAPDITLNTPQIQQIQARMAQRFQGQLAPHFASGALGFGRDGMVVVRDAAALGLRDRAAVPALVAEDNRDRAAVYREIAVANGHPEWEPQVRETFARQWVQSARAGWWYQDASGAWKQK